MASKIKTTIRLPLSTRHEMVQSVVREGYGMHGKSKWVTEAIERLLAIENYPELVDIGDEIGALVAVESFYLPTDLKDRLDRALIVVRQHYPALEGVQSCIIRTSIIQRLLRGS